MRRFGSNAPSMFVFAVLMAQHAASAQDDNICISETNTYTVKVNLYAGELGYYTFEECGDMVNPTIGMEIAQPYTFVQADRSNYYHPMGFSYFPDGAHDGVDELEPGISRGRTTCAGTMSCPAPMYFLNDEYLGAYSNIHDRLWETKGEDDFGLDNYEPLFFYPLPDWAGMGTFSIRLSFTDTTYTEDIFYFCHIHQFMTGRIKLLDNGVPINTMDTPPIDYSYDAPGPFDQSCGTYGLDDFTLPNAECPSRFVCRSNDDSDDDDSAMNRFNDCIDAMDCHMFAGMTTYTSTNEARALFIHQMIPHHQNAVNMAKALMYTGDVNCEDLTDDENDDCVMEVILREIINVQNHQIQVMRGILDQMGWPETDDCRVQIASEQKFL